MGLAAPATAILPVLHGYEGWEIYIFGKKSIKKDTYVRHRAKHLGAGIKPEGFNNEFARLVHLQMFRRREIVASVTDTTGLSIATFLLDKPDHF